MCLSVKGIRPNDDRYDQMKKIFDTCQEADVEIPREVWDFFGHEPPCPDGIEVDVVFREFKEEMVDGIEVKVEDIPRDVKILKFRKYY